jgi:hypothetical protein
MEANQPEDISALWGRQAVKWLFGREEGGSFFDGALHGVGETFGFERNVAAIAPLNLRSEPTGFFLQVEGSTLDDADWSRLVAAHELLIRHRLGRGGAVPRYDDLHLVLDPLPIAAVPLGLAQEAWLR